MHSRSLTTIDLRTPTSRDGVVEFSPIRQASRAGRGGEGD